MNTAKLKRIVYHVRLALIRAAFRLMGKRQMIRLLVQDAKRRTKLNVSGPIILSIDRTHFSKDLDQMQKRLPIRLIRVNFGFVEFFEKTFTAAALQRQTHFQPTINDPTFKEDWDRMESFSADLLDAVEKSFKLKVDQILVCNIDYWQTEGMRIVARKRGIPFNALVRENFILPDQQISIREFYLKADFKFEGDKIGVFSDLTKKLYTECRIAPAEQITITGAPRFDYWRDVKMLPAEQKRMISLFTFAHPDYLAPKTFDIVLKIFRDVSDLHPDMKFFVKAKDRGDYFDILQRLGNNKGNLVVGYKANTADVIRDSRLVIGFNSLTMLESLIADVPTGIPHFNDSKGSDPFLIYTPNNPKHDRAIHFYHSEEDLRNHLRESASRVIESRNDNDARLACINSMVYFPENRTNSEVVGEFLGLKFGMEKRDF